MQAWKTLVKNDIQSRMDNIAMLYINFEDEIYFSKRKVLRLSFFDKVSAIGGNLSLFSGFSLMTLVDMGIWMWKKIKFLIFRCNCLDYK